jgi:hypothetical protein
VLSIVSRLRLTLDIVEYPVWLYPFIAVHMPAGNLVSPCLEQGQEQLVSLFRHSTNPRRRNNEFI